MSRIVINPDDLAATASLLESTAGEYQAIGTGVASCDCGCMPADVAAVVDATIADVHGGLQSLAGDLVADSSDLASRAGVPQDSGTNLVISGDTYAPAVSGGGAGLVIYSDHSYSPDLAGGTGLVIGGEAYVPGPYNGGGMTLVIGEEPAPSLAAGGTLTLTQTPGQPGAGLTIYPEVIREMPAGNYLADSGSWFGASSGGGGGFQVHNYVGNAGNYWLSPVLGPPPGAQRPWWSLPNP